MENLNDVEFGSDKNKEEAPILVAQRYLNIYRQVHIFSKAKRDQFDDELLSLPPQITDFFKKMPGGRLLVEHIEDVKTERGIAFIKANKEDFAEGSGKGTSTPTVVAGGVPMVGGSITVDESFAESLAKSMALAFKQNPMQATVSGGNVAGGKVDFGGAFDVIAEEIKSSRASLLDVLKETRSITDSVIASQVSISRILEGILSQRTKDDMGVADLNNRIIASQTSITKLLEGLYMSKDNKSTANFDYKKIENELQNFKDEIRLEMEQNLKKMQELLLSHTQIKETPYNNNSRYQNKENYNDMQSTNNVRSPSSDNIEEDADKVFDEQVENFSQNNQFDDYQKKKKKKNKPFLETDDDFENKTQPKEQNIRFNKEERLQTKTNPRQPQINQYVQQTKPKKFEKEKSLETTPSSSELRTAHHNQERVSSRSGIIAETVKTAITNTGSVLSKTIKAPIVEKKVISNNDFSFDNNLDDILNDLSDFDDMEMAKETSVSFANDVSNLSTKNVIESEDVIAFEKDFEQDTEEFNFKDTYSDDDGLDFQLPDLKESEQDNIPENITQNTNIPSDDGLSFKLPKQGSMVENGEAEVMYDTPKNFVDDGLTYGLPDNDEVLVDNNSYSSFERCLTNDNSSLDDGLEYTLPEEPIIKTDEPEFNTSFEDESFESDNIIDSFELNTPEVVEDDIITNSFDNNEEVLSVSDIFEENDASFETSVQEDYVSSVSENTEFSELEGISKDFNEDTETNIGIDEFLSANESSYEETIIQQQDPRQSLFSDKLDEIRRAITGEDIDISSLDEPIDLDDYSDDENVPFDEDFSIYGTKEQTTTSTPLPSNQAEDDEEWEWEYVEDDEQVGDITDDDEWEWEYVEETEENKK